MAKDRKKGLGTGLGALFGEEPAAEPAVQEQVITELPEEAVAAGAGVGVGSALPLAWVSVTQSPRTQPTP